MNISTTKGLAIIIAAAGLVAFFAMQLGSNLEPEQAVRPVSQEQRESEPSDKTVTDLIDGNQGSSSDNDSVEQARSFDYVNEAYGYGVMLPDGWGAMLGEIAGAPAVMGFGRVDPPQHPTYEAKWTIDVGTDAELGERGFNVNDKTLEDTIARLGFQSSDRQERRVAVTLGGLPATRVIITSAKNPGWIGNVVFASRDDIYYVVRGGTGSDLLDYSSVSEEDPETTFVSFVESFAFIK